MATIADRLNTDTSLDALEIESAAGLANPPVLTTPAAASEVGAKVAGAGLAAFTAASPSAKRSIEVGPEKP